MERGEKSEKHTGKSEQIALALVNLFLELKEHLFYKLCGWVERTFLRTSDQFGKNIIACLLRGLESISNIFL